MGLKQPATKVWEIPEPGRTPLTTPKQEPAKQPEPVAVPEKEREKVPVER